MLQSEVYTRLFQIHKAFDTRGTERVWDRERIHLVLQFDVHVFTYEVHCYLNGVDTVARWIGTRILYRFYVTMCACMMVAPIHAHAVESIPSNHEITHVQSASRAK